MYNLIDDASTLINIPVATMEKIFNKYLYSICHYVWEEIEKGGDTAVIDIGIGTLTIRIEESGARYRFQPSAELEDEILKEIATGESSLKCEVEASIKSKLRNVYKEMF